MTVNVRAIEEELARVQRELTNTEVRTSLFNLVLFQDSRSTTMTDDALTYLLGKRAARVIQITETDEPESAIRASARCFIDAHRKGVCFQEIIISNGADGAGAAPGSWSGLLIREIPTYVVWLTGLADRPEVLRHALEQADKVIIDTELANRDWPDTTNDLFAAVYRLTQAGVVVSDLTWRRLEPLRRLTARAFDDREELLSRIRALQIDGCSEVYAELYTQWICERLGWRRVDSETYDQRGAKVQIAHAYGDTNACAITVRLTLDGPDAAVEISTSSDGCVDIDLPDEHPPLQVVHFPSAGEILLKEVDTVHGDPRYTAVLTY